MDYRIAYTHAYNNIALQYVKQKDKLGNVINTHPSVICKLNKKKIQI